jgi:hypothetical protein
MPDYSVHRSWEHDPPLESETVIQTISDGHEYGEHQPTKGGTE